jgi:penicillin-binding protein 1A
MMEALADRPAIPFRVPPDLRMVRIDLTTGQRPSGEGGRIILESFKPGTEPNGQVVVIGGSGDVLNNSGSTGTLPTGTGGLY